MQPFATTCTILVLLSAAALAEAQRSTNQTVNSTDCMQNDQACSESQYCKPRRFDCTWGGDGWECQVRGSCYSKRDLGDYCRKDKECVTGACRSGECVACGRDEQCAGTEFCDAGRQRQRDRPRPSNTTAANWDDDDVEEVAVLDNWGRPALVRPDGGRGDEGGRRGGGRTPRRPRPPPPSFECRAKMAVYETCRRDAECETGLCQRDLSPEQLQGLDEGIPRGLAGLQEGQCAVRRAVGQACRYRRQCLTDRCDYVLPADPGRECLAKVVLGGACDDHRDCASDLCDGGVCVNSTVCDRTDNGRIVGCQANETCWGGRDVMIATKCIPQISCQTDRDCSVELPICLRLFYRRSVCAQCDRFRNLCPRDQYCYNAQCTAKRTLLVRCRFGYECISGFCDLERNVCAEQQRG